MFIHLSIKIAPKTGREGTRLLFDVCERLVSLLILFRIAFCAGSKTIRYSMSVALISFLCNLDEDKASDEFSFTIAGTAQRIFKANKGIKYNII